MLWTFPHRGDKFEVGPSRPIAVGNGELPPRWGAIERGERGGMRWDAAGCGGPTAVTRGTTRWKIIHRGGARRGRWSAVNAVNVVERGERWNAVGRGGPTAVGAVEHGERGERGYAR